jgi:hypothetical protein
MPTSAPAPAPSTGARSTGARLLRAGGPALLALGLALLAWALQLHGTDASAQTYHIDVVRSHGLILWDSGWYGGDLPLGYSVLAPVAGALIGLAATMVAAAVVAAWCFDRILIRVTGARPLGSWYFAASSLLAVAIGQEPYLTGEAVALAAVLAAVAGRRVTAATLAVVCALFSPLAAAFLVMTVVVWAVSDRERRGPMLAAGVAAGAVVAVTGLAFPGDGPFPFAWPGLVVVELLCLTVLSPLVRATRAVRLGAAVYGLASLASFVVANPLGGNATRLAESVGIPLVACLVRRRPEHEVAGATRAAGAGWHRPAVGLAALAPFVVWQWAPGTAVLAGASTVPSNTAAFYRPLVAEMQRVTGGRPTRLEVVPTREHWESAYVATHVALARGWERQVDLEDNPIFYRAGALDAATYRSWLARNGVSWVALPAAPLDYAGRAEGAVLRGGVTGLRVVWSTPAWTLWSVGFSPGIVSGDATLTALEPDRVALDVRRPGPLLVRVRYTTYWRLGAGDGCVRPSGAEHWTELDAARAGIVVLRAALSGGSRAACPGR